ncbi:hypothetical protein [Ktedonobacter racemifer]|nr:hypothetical protein [Ktedonobacter racemifer]
MIVEDYRPLAPEKVDPSAQQTQTRERHTHTRAHARDEFTHLIYSLSPKKKHENNDSEVSTYHLTQKQISHFAMVGTDEQSGRSSPSSRAATEDLSALPVAEKTSSAAGKEWLPMYRPQRAPRANIQAHLAPMWL